MTDEEHIARAMLLGMKYTRGLGVYSRDDFPSGFGGVKEIWYDAETLVELTATDKLTYMERWVMLPVGEEEQDEVDGPEGEEIHRLFRMLDRVGGL